MLPTLQEAIEAIKAGDKETGRQMLADILQADLENEQAWLWLSGVVDSDEEKRKYLSRVLEINPDIKLAYVGRAKTHLDMGTYEGAVKDATEAIRRLPDMPNPYTIRGRALNFMGEYQKALADYDQAVKLIEQLLDDDENKDAVKRALIETIQERPKAVPLLLAAARIFMKEGEVEIATRFFKTAQMVDPKAFFEIVDEFYDALKTFPKEKRNT